MNSLTNCAGRTNQNRYLLTLTNTVAISGLVLLVGTLILKLCKLQKLLCGAVGSTLAPSLNSLAKCSQPKSFL